MQNEILFNNIYIGHSVEDAEKLRKETFDVKRPVEAAEEEAAKPKKEETGTPSVSFKEDPVLFVREKVDHFVGLAKQDPVHAVKQVPEVAGGLGALLVTMILIIMGAIGVSSPAPSTDKKKGKEAAGVGKEKTGGATSSSADTGKGGATKRNTKSSE